MISSDVIKFESQDLIVVEGDRKKEIDTSYKRFNYRLPHLAVIDFKLSTVFSDPDTEKFRFFFSRGKRI